MALSALTLPGKTASRRFMSQGPVKHYRDLIASGQIESDGQQRAVVEKLQLLANRFAVYDPPSQTDWFSYFTRKRGEVPKGLYMFGGVGRGKTMLMDLFFETVEFSPKRRVHFHQFMRDTHERIAVARKRHDGDPVPHVAAEIAREAMLLCFDELHVTDIADAMILSRLLAGLFEHQVVIVATSNAAPSELYRDGLNRQLFIPFIDLLEDTMEIIALESPTDYRLKYLEGRKIYFAPADDHAHAAMRGIWRQMTGQDAGREKFLQVKGRDVRIAEADGGVALTVFDDLCGMPLGSNDYLAIAEAFHTIILEAVPVLGPEKRNEARRFINLIDTLYDNRVRLIISADAEPHQLYIAGDGVDLFERTASRLMEMRSDAYLQAQTKE